MIKQIISDLRDTADFTRKFRLEINFPSVIEIIGGSAIFDRTVS